MNPTKKGVTLVANSIVASVSTVQSDSILPLNDKGNNSKSTDKDSVASDNIENDPLEFNLDNSDLNGHKQSLLTHFLNKNRQVFAKNLSELGHTNVYLICFLIQILNLSLKNLVKYSNPVVNGSSTNFLSTLVKQNAFFLVQREN